MNVTQTLEGLWELHRVHQLELCVFHKDEEIDEFPICKYTKDKEAGRETGRPTRQIGLTVELDNSAWPEDVFLSIQFDSQHCENFRKDLGILTHLEVWCFGSCFLSLLFLAGRGRPEPAASHWWVSQGKEGRKGGREDSGTLVDVQGLVP